MIRVSRDGVDMSEFKVIVELADVGHTAKAIAHDGSVLASAVGFGERDARRQLQKRMGELRNVDPSIPKRFPPKKKSRKIHNPSGVIFAAKRNIEAAKAKRVGIRRKKSI